MVVVGVVLLVVAGVLLLIRRSRQSKLRRITGTETSTAKELAELASSVSQELGGRTGFSQAAEVKGLAKCDSPLTSEVASQSCVYYDMRVTREYEETYYETDSQSGRRVQKTRRSSDTVAQNSQRVSFWVEDRTGRIKVDPSGADLDSVQVVDRFEPAPSGGTISFGGFALDVGVLALGTGSGTRTLGYRFRESILPVDRQVYVLGEATDSPGELTIQAPRDKGRPFIISLKSLCGIWVSC
jgi:hypothetical protein